MCSREWERRTVSYVSIRVDMVVNDRAWVRLVTVVNDVGMQTDGNVGSKGK